ncbi:DUF484 family protein [Amaricoccus tamworthensis]|uniref:DUF484 family protein n=1 Tax=Amaricoccus tamworthensis TaxID=57002 RepID=UPI003C7DF79E
MDVIDKTAEQNLKDLILENPELILRDADLMRALLQADRSTAGRNVVDLRAVLVERLEERLDKLEDTHREVLAAAYENVAGTNQIHRACLSVLEPESFASFLDVMTHDLATTLAVDVVRLGLEAPGAEAGSGLGPEGPSRNVVIALPDGGATAYVTQGRGMGARKITLRQLAQASPDLYGEYAPTVRSEAVMMLDLGPGKRPGLLAVGAEEPDRFHADQGTDLLVFFTGIFERALRRWLA